MYGLLDYVYTHPPSAHPPLPEKKNGAPFPRLSFVEGSRVGCGYT